VIDLCDIADGILDCFGVAYVSLNDRKLFTFPMRTQPIEVVPHAAARQIIEDANPNAWMIQETLGKI
jgi:hypothetical protein